MKFLSYFPTSLLPLTLLTPNPTHAKTTYSTSAADSAISRGQGNGLSDGAPLISYEHGEFQWALRLLYERTGNQSYFDYIRAGVDNNVADNGTVGGAYK
jgi:rhamnogalacturonyl hydrolase YesR